MQTNLSIISARFQAMKSQLMTKAGAIMLQFTDDRFREQGWKDESLTPWAIRKSNKDAGRSILIKSGLLRRSNRIISKTEHSITIGSDVPYAKAHNDGFHGPVTVKAHTRKGFSKSLKVIGDIQVKSFTRNMNFPERRFMGTSATLKKQIRDLITDEVKQCFK